MKRAGALSSAQVADPQSGRIQDDDIQLTSVSTDQQTMQELAEDTGGIAVSNTNQIEEPVQRMMEDIRTHYEGSLIRPPQPTTTGTSARSRSRSRSPRSWCRRAAAILLLARLNGEPLQPFEVMALKAINKRPHAFDFPYHVAAMEFRPKENAVDYEVAFEVPTSALTVVCRSENWERSHSGLGVRGHPRHPWRDRQQGRP